MPELKTPEELSHLYPVSSQGRTFVAAARRTLRNILRGNDHRLCVVVGPCSIHDFASAFEYAQRLKDLAGRVDDTLFVVMRAYVEKPRTATGWKGLINDPDLDGSCRIGKGLAIARGFLRELAELGLPAATEAVDPLAQGYLRDLVCWTAIGARTAESQTHREMASGLASPVGFKNSTSGDVRAAVNAMRCCAQSHSLLTIDASGRSAIVKTEGNQDTQLVLRGGAQPNYDKASVARCERLLAQHGLEPTLLIDCSHGNSQGDFQRQTMVLDDVAQQILEGNRSIRGVLLESHLHEGNQAPARLDQLRYGVSITDKCLDWETTERILLELRERLRGILPRRNRPPKPLPQLIRRDTYPSPLQLLALLQQLNLAILSGPSATISLENWCRDHRLGEEPRITAERIGDAWKDPSAGRLERLQVASLSEVNYRRVRLRCGARVLAEADNWYVPSRLTGEVNRLLENTDTPFGRAVRCLNPQRYTISAKVLWSPLTPNSRNEPTELCDAADIPDSLLEHHALLVTPERGPISLVEEVYKRPALMPAAGQRS